MTTNKVIGILGGGQLGRMSAIAAYRLGFSCVIYCPKNDTPASKVCDKTIIGAYEDKDKLRDFANLVDVITYEFENIPVETIEFLQTLKPVRPGVKLLEISQDRITEKSYLNDIGIPTARWIKVTDEENLHATLELWNAQECIIKTCRFGYDGKGQIRYNKNEKLSVAIQNLHGTLIAEEIIDFTDELSVITARDTKKKCVSYGPILNVHKKHILHKTIVPAPLDKNIQEQAVKIAEQFAQHIDLTGLVTLELFLTKEGKLLANEIAPRTHNSGHWSIDACAVSQFENHIRTVSGLPAGNTDPVCESEMLNLIGDDIDNLAPYYSQKNACIHLYGKTEAKAGRKMGHITFLKKQL